MNNREKARVEKYLITYPHLRNIPKAIEELNILCKDPCVGHPANATNQRIFRQARKARDNAVHSLAESLK